VKSQLLPEGFRDSLPDLAKEEFKVNSMFLELMNKNGYSLVRPPLLEFENSLFFLTKDTENLDSFRVLDPLSQKMMGIRSDITLQIARICCGSLSKNPRPLKLCYSGEILKVKNNSLNMSRQSIQIGSEIIGIEENSCENQVINLIIDILQKLKIKKFIINFTMPTLIESISKDFNLNKKDYEFVKEKFRNKNISGLDIISKKLEKVSSVLLSSIGNLSENISIIKKFKFPIHTQREIGSFIRIVNSVKKEFSNLKILIDPLEIDESNYHSGMAFKVYSENLKELFSGGNYKIFNENCIGFSGFVENLVKETKIIPDSEKKIFVSINLSNDLKKNLIKKGFIVIQAIKNHSEKKMMREAKLQKCEYLFVNNKILKME
tara:strand:+ start:1307 stop:2437 length:1131 start_codon:yes stop_codon:yes gene_type:complete